jgi:hypothetical protein
LDWETTEVIILITGSTLTGVTIPSITATGTHLSPSISVSVTDGIIIIMAGMDGVITAIGMITDPDIFHTMIVMEIIIVPEDFHTQIIPRGTIQAAILNLYVVVIQQDEMTHR